MFKFNSLRHKTLINHLKGLTLQSQNPNPLFHRYPSLFSTHFCTNTSDSTPFPVSYLINKFDFSPQFASKLCYSYRLRFKTAKKPDSVLAFFRNYGFSDSQLRHMIPKLPDLLSCNPSKRVLPKFQFFLSKGASTSDIVNLVSKNPRVLSPSLKNHIVPTYEVVYRILKSHDETITRVILDPVYHGNNHVHANIRLLIENGVSDSNIARLLRNWGQVFRTHDMLKLVEELKDLGFSPTQTTFAIALHAKTYVIKNLWKEKVDAFKKWGWSDEDVVIAFKKQPYCMLVSIDKINLLMSFWVDQLGWDPLVLAKGPSLFLLSLEKRIIPRAEVVQFLLKKGLREKNASLTCPFVVPEKVFLDMFINRFKESSYLFKLYQEKLNLPCTRDKTCMSWSKLF
ncbi:hypothetical protein TSUD_400720 [Trifolium subterraneum]|uniref:Uncharacterized protein n=1 Tax=Trifolium subterraneum TaxID=3900 RepID=A0A2Z6PAG8_TRISU|nr:hypothetical protein TSUD_400720 [Trifolium subterraneum]